MARRNRNDDGSFLDRMIRPLMKSRVTLTKAGKSQAPLRKGKAAKPTGKKAEAAQSLRPKTAREKQVNELKLLADIGKRDPERLAGIISRMLLEGQEKEEANRLKFERLVWEKAEKKRPASDEAAETGGNEE